MSPASIPLRPNAPAVVGPAAQVFAAELRRGARGERAGVPADAAALLAAGPLPAAPVGDPAAAPIDLRGANWPEPMVDRIERLRDAANAADTRIRLVPDALGAIDLAVKREGDLVHVHLSADQAATRALLGDAAPRLAEAAEARGVRLGQTTVDGGGAGRDGGQERRPAAAPSAPIPARPRDPADEGAADTRIA